MAEFNAITKSYITVAYAERFANEIEEVYNILAHAEKPMRCKEIAKICAGAKWDRLGWMQESFISTVAHALTALKKKQFVRRFEEDGEPIILTEKRYVRDYADNKPSTIEVNGIVYVRQDRPLLEGHWEEYKRTITPKIAYFEIIK